MTIFRANVNPKAIPETRYFAQKSQKPDYARYEQLKAQWVRAYPEASVRDYTAAMQTLAQRCGL